jgi:hypothetical protein
MKRQTTTTAAEVVFYEKDPVWQRVAAGRLPLGRWDARFLHRETVLGSILGRPASAKDSILTIREVPYSDFTIYEWTTPGETKPNGNRHESARSLSEAQDRIAKWAGRRFRVEVPR